MTYVSNCSWDADFRDGYKHVALEELLDGRRDDKENTVPDISELTDEEFVDRLARMRYEHQQTLEFCDRFGLCPRDSEPDSELTTHTSCPVATVDKHYTVTTSSSFAGDLMTTDVGGAIRPNFKARKAPPPPKKCVPTAGQWKKSTRREREKCLSDQLKTEREQMREYALDKYLASLSDEEAVCVESGTDIKEDAETRRHRLVKSNCLSELVDDDWRYRVTVPKPFRMTVREMQKEPTKSRSTADFERQRSRQRVEEELECSMKFKASPAPATIYVPLFEKLEAEKLHRRRLNLAARHKQHIAMQQPFAFLRREEERSAEKQRHRADQDVCDACAPDANFKAKPFPQHLFSSEVCKQMDELEKMKDSRRKERSDKLLRNSSLPKNMTKKRPSHVCDMTSDDGCCAVPNSGTVKHRSARARVSTCVPVSIASHMHVTPGWSRSVAAVCGCHGDRQQRWPATCLSANQLSRSLSVSEVRAQSPASDTPSSKPVRKLSSTAHDRRINAAAVSSSADQTRLHGGKVGQSPRKSPSSCRRQPASVTLDDDDYVRRQIEEDLKHI